MSAQPITGSPVPRAGPALPDSRAGGARRPLWFNFRVVLAAILILALGLRLFWIDHQSLWGDEGSTWDTIRSGLPEAIERTRALDSLAPLYFVLLWFWTQIATTSETGLRSLSAVAGTVGVGAVALIADRLAGRRATLIAAVLAAISPLWVYYSQEARPYALAAALAAGAAACALRLVEGGRVRPAWLAGYVVCAIGAGLTHYFAVFAIGAAILAVPRTRTGLTVWLAATAAAGVPLLIWIGSGWSRFAGVAASGGPRGLPWPAYLIGLAEAFASGLNPNGLPQVAMAIGVGLASVGAIGRRGALPALWLVLVATGVQAAGFPSDRPGPWVRYALAGLPAFIVLEAIGVDRLWRRSRPAGGVAALALIGLSVIALGHVYFHPGLARFDFRTPVRDLKAALTPEDRVIVNVGNPAFLYYYGDESLPRPSYFMEEVVNVPDDQIRDRLTQAVAGARRVYLVKYMPPEFDPKQQIEHWLNTHGTKTAERWIEHIRLVSYDWGAALPLDDPVVRRVEARLGDRVELLGWTLRPETRAGEPTVLTLYWRAREPLTTDYLAFVHAVAADDPERRVTQHDSRPGVGSRPTTEWTAGEVVIDAHPLTLPAGEWLFSVGLADMNGLKRLPVQVPGRPEDSRVLLGPVTVP
ncbi:MAG TPA: glycosyltransferase family 39 protein [Dehalococcoidia bacterium]|nr:glycosyltransferase family 39 protein [Dehalococcoidia bacterium]